jgi:DNA-binding transcriptional ArsR family regulator
VGVDAELMLDALGDATRRAVFGRLRGGALSVAEIAQGVNVSRPAVSQHLKVLKDAGLLVVHSEGARNLYEVDAQAIRALRAWLDDFWDDALLAFKEAAEREAAEREKRQ